MPDIARLRDKAVELGVNTVLPAYSKVAAKVTELGDTRVGRMIEGAAARGIEAVHPAVRRAERVAGRSLEIVGAGRLVPGRPTKDAPTPKRPSRRSPSTRPGTGRNPSALAGKLVSAPEPSRPEDLPLVGYDALVADEILVRLKGLTQSELAQLYKYEKAREARSTVLDGIEARLIDLPLPTYDSLRVAAILDAVNGLTRKELYTIHEYERTTRHRLPIIERIESLLAS
jgi:hypothetical protein